MLDSVVLIFTTDGLAVLATSTRAAFRDSSTSEPARELVSPEAVS